jgi:hypothetical protein
MQELAASEKGKIVTYDNTQKAPEETHYALTLEKTNTANDRGGRVNGADYNEQIWYLYNKGYSQKIPMKTAVVNKLKRVARDIMKLSMAATSYQVIYDGAHRLILRNHRGEEYTFDNFNVKNVTAFRIWLINEVAPKNKENIGKNSVEDIILEIVTKVRRGETNFNIKFFNFPGEFDLPLVY